ncbi:DUF397 domain-containing protein [Streptomyces griseocarneus]|nr:DUF397 domain-containing protein [Streptomyces griseocarneus]
MDEVHTVIHRRPFHQGWRKSSYSPDSDGNCIEIRPAADLIVIGDTKDHFRGTLGIPSHVWADFIGAAYGDALRMSM